MQSWLSAPNDDNAHHGTAAGGLMALEVITHGGVRYAEIIRADLKVEKTTFFSPAESSFQFGLLAHEAGFVEPPHYHREFERPIKDLQQMFVVQRGVVGVQLFSDDGELLREVELKAGDAIVLIHGVHAIRVIEDMQCISVKQGPFLGDQYDKVFVGSKS
jgi:hypothetical protein